MNYKQAGVDVSEGYKAVDMYKSHAMRTHTSGVLTGLGAFNGMFAINEGMQSPVLVAGSDGVGTKIDIALQVGIYNTVGIDCVAMCVNDILTSGAVPLFFLDYLATSKLEADVAAGFVEGVADGCVEAGCALLGGETAEMPGIYSSGKWDLAGFAVGAVNHSDIIDGSTLTAGDVLVGLTSSGVHSNGFSLVRKLVCDLDEVIDTQAGKMPIGQVLLEPTFIYVETVMDAIKSFPRSIHAMCHITGGGFYENIPRMLPTASDTGHLVACIRRHSWRTPAIFDELVRRGADADDMFATFNMGIGFIMAVEESAARSLVDHINHNAHSRHSVRQRKVAPQIGANIIGYVDKSTSPVKGDVKGNRDLVHFYE